MASRAKIGFYYIGIPVGVAMVCGLYVLTEAQKIKYQQKDRLVTTAVDDLPPYMAAIRKAEKQRVTLEDEFKQTVEPMDLKDYDMVPIKRPEEWREDDG